MAKLGGVLYDWFNLPWEQARGLVSQQFETIMTAVRAMQARQFNTDSQLLSQAIGGDGTPATRYVANTGPNNAPFWDRVSLGDGVQGQLALARLATATASTLLGRRASGSGSVELITLDSTLSMSAGGVLSAVAGSPVTVQATPANPTGSASAAGLMMGLAVAITPGSTGRILVHVSGDISNNTAADGARVQIRYGTGTAPVNGAALAGTALGGLVKFTKALAGQQVPFALQGIISGLSVATAYWIDISLAVDISALTLATVADLSVSAHEVR